MCMRRRTALRLGLATRAAGGIGAVPGTASAAVATPPGGRGGTDLSDEALVRSLPGFRNGYATVIDARRAAVRNHDCLSTASLILSSTSATGLWGSATWAVGVVI